MFYFRALSLLLYHKSEDSCTFYCPKLLNFQGSQHIFNVRKLSYEIFEEQRTFETTEHFKEKHKIRWKIEQRNSHLKNRYGLNKTYGTGLWSMKAQSFLTAFTANIVKITKLVATI